MMGVGPIGVQTASLVHAADYSISSDITGTPKADASTARILVEKLYEVGIDRQLGTQNEVFFELLLILTRPEARADVKKAFDELAEERGDPQYETVTEYLFYHAGEELTFNKYDRASEIIIYGHEVGDTWTMSNRAEGFVDLVDMLEESGRKYPAGMAGILLSLGFVAWASPVIVGGLIGVGIVGWVYNEGQSKLASNRVEELKNLREGGTFLASVLLGTLGAYGSLSGATKLGLAGDFTSTASRAKAVLLYDSGLNGLAAANDLSSKAKLAARALHCVDDVLGGVVAMGSADAVINR